MSGFSNSVVGGVGTLVRNFIQSLNFVTGVSGWRISRNGDAEFNNGTFRGTLTIGAFPNPRIVMTSTDIPTELVTWGAANNVTINAVILKYWNSNEYKWEATGTFAGIPCAFSGTYDVTNGVYVIDRIIVLSGGDLGIQYRIGSYSLNSTQLDMYTSQTYFHVGDGSYIKDSFDANVDTWHAFPFANGWTNNGGGFSAFQYHLEPTMKRVAIEGVIKSPNPFNGVIGTLPAGYRPQTTQAIWASINAGTDQLILVANTGVVTGFGSAAINTAWFVNGSISLDAA